MISQTVATAVIAAATLAACATPAPAPASPITDAERVQAYCAAALMPPGFADLCKPDN